MSAAIARESAASRIEVLIGLYQTIVTTLNATMTKTTFVEGREHRRRHNLELHAGLIIAIREQDAITLEKLSALHRHDMTRLANSPLAQFDGVAETPTQQFMTSMTRSPRRAPRTVAAVCT